MSIDISVPSHTLRIWRSHLHLCLWIRTGSEHGGTAVPQRHEVLAEEFEGWIAPRMTTSYRYLSIIIQKLIEWGCDDYKQVIPLYLYSGQTCKKTLNNDAEGCFYYLPKVGRADTPSVSTHQHLPQQAHAHLLKHIQKQLANIIDTAAGYLSDLQDAITQKTVLLGLMRSRHQYDKLKSMPCGVLSVCDNAPHGPRTHFIR